MKEKGCLFIDMLEMLWPLTCEPLNAPATQIVFNQYLNLMQANGDYPSFCKIIAISFNRWILEIKTNKQPYAHTMAATLFKQALSLDFFKNAPEDFKTIWELLNPN